jgi:exonuclease SbcC
MSHSETIIEPADGLTVLAGPNNCGKSAVITALQTLCYNERGDFMMRHGTSACRVVVETDDGHVIEWERTKKKSVRYIIDGREIDRLRGSVPDDLHEKLRLPHVESADGSDGFDIHFAEQKKPIFLLDQNGRQAATFFASSSDAALLVEMQAEHKRNVSDHRGDERSLVKDIARCSKQLEPLEGVPTIDATLELLENDYLQLTGSLDELSKLEQCATTLEAQVEQRTEFLTSMQALAFLQTPPILLDTKPVEQIVLRFDDVLSRRFQENARQQVLVDLNDPPVIHATSELESLLEEFADETATVGQLTERQESLQSLESPPPLAEENDLAELIAAIDAEQLAQHQLQSEATWLKGLTEPPTISDVEKLTETVQDIERATATLRQIERVETRLAQLDEPHTPYVTTGLTELIEECSTAFEQKSVLTLELQSFDQQRHELIESMMTWAKENPTCPTCGALTKPNEWIESKEREADVPS